MTFVAEVARRTIRQSGHLASSPKPTDPAVVVLMPPTSGTGAALGTRVSAACERAGRPAEIASATDELATSSALVIDLSGSFRARAGQEVWQLQAGEGGLTGRFALAAVWHRAPHWLAVVLTRTCRLDAGPARSETLGVAYVGTSGSLQALRDKVADVAGILVQQALAGGPAAVGPAETPQRRRQDGAAALVGGWLRWQAARWRARMLVEWWTVGIAERSIGAVLEAGDLGPVRWLRSRRGKDFWADPFSWPGSRDILVEECPVSGGPGTIAVLRQAADGLWGRARILLGDRLHRSYPATYVEGEQAYVLPECLEGEGVVLFRLGSGAPEPVCTVWPSPIADATLFRHDDCYWVAGTDVAIGLHDNLCLFHADRLSGPWRPHRGNPVKLDIRSSRPAGTPFEHGGKLFRPAQDCAGGYGRAVVVNEVLELSEETYLERPALRLAPDPRGPLPDGLHTLSAAGDRTLVDGKRMVAAPGLAVRRMAARLLGQRRR